MHIIWVIRPTTERCRSFRLRLRASGCQLRFCLRRRPIPGRQETGGVPPKPPATFSLCRPQCSGTSVHSTGGVAASFLTRCRGSRVVRPCRCGDFGFVSRHKPAEHHVPMFLQLQTMRRHVSRPVAAGVSLSAVHIFSRFRCVRRSLQKFLRRQRLSRSTFKVAAPLLCFRGNLYSFFMTLFTCRGRHHSSSRGGGAWGQCCHVEGQTSLIYLWRDSGAAQA